MKNILMSVITLLSVSALGGPTIVETNFPANLFENPAKAEFIKKKMKEMNITKCEKILGSSAESIDLSKVKQLCNQSNDVQYSCSMSCGIESDSQYVHTPMNAYNSITCDSDQCDENIVELFKQSLRLKNQAYCEGSSSNTFKLPSGTMAQNAESDECTVFQHENYTSVTCHNLCKRKVN